MSSTMEDRLKTNYEKALNVGQNVSVRACTVLLKGVPVADKLIGLSNTQKKNLGFNPAQIRTIESRCPLNAMDLSLLHAIQRAFGGLAPGHLHNLLKEFKDLRNDFVHEQQNLSLNKRELRARLAKLTVLYRAILEALKHHCDPIMITVLDTDIADMEARLLLLNKTMDDHIQDKIEALRQASGRSATQMIQSSAILDQKITRATGTLGHAVAQASVNLDDTINQARTNMGKITASLDQQLSDSTDAVKQKINQATSDLDINLNQTLVNINKQANDTAKMFESLQQVMMNMTGQLRQTTIEDQNSNQTAYPVERSVIPKTKNESTSQNSITTSEDQEADDIKNSGKVNLCMDKVKAVMVRNDSDLCKHDNCDDAVVIDNGSYTCFAGFAGYNAPIAVVPSIVGTHKYQEKDVPKHSYVGDDAQARRGILSLSYPIERSIVTNWDDMEKIWHHTFINELRVKSENHSVLITEAILNPKSNREKMTQVFFETFNVPGFYIARQPTLSLYASGRVNGTVIEVGHGVTQIANVYEQYHLLPDASKRIDLAGGDISNYLAKLLNDRGYNFTKESENDIVRDIKEKHCHISQDDSKDFQAKPEALDSVYELPDGSKLTLGNERFRAPEILFQPSLMNLPYSGIHKSAVDSIKSCDADIHGDLFNNIILSGGSTLFPGFADRLQKEMASLVPSNKELKVITHEDGKYATWVGGSILASLPNSQTEFQWISKEEYDEAGPAIVHRKCFR